MENQIEDHEEQQQVFLGEVYAVRCLQSLQIYLWPIDLKAWCKIALEERFYQDLILSVNHVCRRQFTRGAQRVFDLVDRLPLFGMSWRLNQLVKQLNKNCRIDPEDQDLWRRD